MSNVITEEEVLSFLRDLLPLEGHFKEGDELSNDLRFERDLGLDSLSQVNMIMAAEDQFSLTIPEDDALNIITVGDLIKYLAKSK